MSSLKKLEEISVSEDAFHPGSLTEFEATTASWLAWILVGSFAVSIVGSLGFYCFMLMRLANIDHATPGSEAWIKEMIESCRGPMSQVGAIFSPLLGFILGYYFSKRDKPSRRP